MEDDYETKQIYAIYDIQSAYFDITSCRIWCPFIFVYLTKLLPVKYFAILAAVLAALVLLFWIIIQTGKKKNC